MIRRPSAHLVLLASLPISLACGTACVSDTGRAPATPSSATPGIVQVNVGDFVDSDANRYRDTTRTTVYIYADSGQYPIPMRVSGTFEFILEDARGNRITKWTFDQAQSAAAARMLAPGPGYIFDLSLVGADKLESTEGQIQASFTPKGGKPIWTRGSATVAIGRVSSGRRTP